MLRISSRSGARGRRILLVEGTLGGAWVSELETACRQLVHERGAVALDLSAVTFVDRAGADLLNVLRADPRVEIGRVSAFVAETMKGGAA